MADFFTMLAETIGENRDNLRWDNVVSGRATQTQIGPQNFPNAYAAWTQFKNQTDLYRTLLADLRTSPSPDKRIPEAEEDKVINALFMYIRNVMGAVLIYQREQIKNGKFRHLSLFNDGTGVFVPQEFIDIWLPAAAKIQKSVSDRPGVAIAANMAALIKGYINEEKQNLVQLEANRQAWLAKKEAERAAAAAAVPPQPPPQPTTPEEAADTAAATQEIDTSPPNVSGGAVNFAKKYGWWIVGGIAGVFAYRYWKRSR